MKEELGLLHTKSRISLKPRGTETHTKKELHLKNNNNKNIIWGDGRYKET